MIPTVTIETYKNTRQNRSFFCPTEDRVFLLTIDESKEYFPSDSVRVCKPTPAAAAIAESASLRNYGHAFWWLRSQGRSRDYNGSVVDPNGRVSGYSIIEIGVGSADWCTVRPAMWISLEG